MATSSAQQTLQIQAFPCYTKRKLDSEESSMSLVYENGVFTPRSEKRQRFNGNNSEIESQSLEQNVFSMNSNAEGFSNGSGCEQSMQEDSEMMEETTYSNHMEENAAQKMNGEENFNGVSSEIMTEITNSSTNGVHVNLPRTKALNCTTPAVNSFCFQGGLLDNMLVHYHGL